MKTKIALGIASICTLLCLGTTPVSASENASKEVQPRVAVVQCPKCSGTIQKVVATSTRTYEHEEAFSCTHGKKYDIYKVYSIKKYAKCYDCGYLLKLSETDEHVYSRCSNSI